MRMTLSLGIVLVLLLGVGGLTLWLSSGQRVSETTPTRAKTETHTEWIEKTLEKTKTIHPGMTRADLLKLFTEDGGLSSVSQRRYVYRECPYIKVNVTFTLVELDADGRLTSRDSPDDIIKTISTPYLDNPVDD